MSFVVIVIPLLMDVFGKSSALQSRLTLQWSANVSTDYPPRNLVLLTVLEPVEISPTMPLYYMQQPLAVTVCSNPLRVSLGTKLLILCPEDGTSNVWIQRHREQYDNCDCNAVVIGDDPIRSTCFNCDSSRTIFHVCQDEVELSIESQSQHLCSALGFDSDTVYYLISYSHGESPLAGYNRTLTSGGQCLEGFKMALRVLPTDSETTSESVNRLQTTTTFTEAPTTTALVLETNESSHQISFKLTTSDISYTVKVTDDGNGTATIQDKSERRLLVIIVCLIASYSSFLIS